MRTRGFVKELEEIVKPSYSTMSYFSEYDSVRLPDCNFISRRVKLKFEKVFSITSLCL